MLNTYDKFTLFQYFMKKKFSTDLVIVCTKKIFMLTFVSLRMQTIYD